MDIQKYVAEKKEIRKIFIKFIEDEEGMDANYQNLINILKSHKIEEKPEEFRALFYMINKVSKNHHRHPNFFNQIEKIILYLESKIKQTFSNYDIYDFFKSNKRVLLFLFTKKIITIDMPLFSIMFDKDLKGGRNNCAFFYPEVKTVADDENRKEIEDAIKKSGHNVFDNFEEKRHIGENDAKICALIRNDSLDDFISHVTRNKISISSHIKRSIFETHSFLINKKPTLIEYAAFFGSIRIFNFLIENHVELTSSLWLYAIHSNNIQLIQLLHENGIKPEDASYTKSFIESIKCHHDVMSNYINKNLMKNDHDVNESLTECYFRYYNYEFFPDTFNNDFIYLDLCKYDYLQLVKFFINSSEVNSNATNEIRNCII